MPEDEMDDLGLYGNAGILELRVCRDIVRLGSSDARIDW